MRGSRAAALVSLLLLALALAQAATPRATVARAQEAMYWVKFYVGPISCLAAVPLANSSPEVVAIPNYILFDYRLLQSPYPSGSYCAPIYFNVSEPSLVVMKGATAYVFNGLTLYGTYNLTAGQPSEDYSQSALVVGRYVLFNGSVYEAPVSNFVAEAFGGTLYLIYLKGGKIIAYDATFNTTAYTGPSFNMTALLGAYFLPTVDGLAAIGNITTANGTAALYEVMGVFEKPTYVILSVPVTQVVYAYGYSPNGFTPLIYFYVMSGDRLFRVGPSGATPIAVGYYLGHDEDNIYLYNPAQRRIVAIGIWSGKTSFSVPVPQGVTPQMLATWGDILALYSNGYLYVTYTGPTISVSLNAPSTVYVYEPFTYSIQVSNANNFSLMLNGEPIPPQGTLSLPTPGVYTFTVFATNGIVSVERNFTLTVLPRPINIQLRLLSQPYAYSTAEAEVETYDALNGSRVVTLCSIRNGNSTVSTLSWEGFNVSLTPPSVKSPYVTLEVTCGNNDTYMITSQNFTVSLFGARPVVKVDYLGYGELEFFFYGPGGTTQINGTVTAYVNGTYYGKGYAPFTLTLIEPGTSKVAITFTPFNPVFSSYTYYYTVTYYYNVSQAPPTATNVTVANLLGTPVTTYVTQTAVVKVPEYMYVTNTDQLLMVSMASLVAGMVVGAYFLGGGKGRKDEEEKGEKPNFEPF